MTRIRSSLLLLGVCVVAVLIGALRLATQTTPLLAGTSYSAQPDGAKGLYSWLETLGAAPTRLHEPSVNPTTATLLILQPETPINRPTRDAFDAVAEHGGTLVIAGDSAASLLYVKALGFTAEPVAPQKSEVTTPDGLRFSIAARYRVHADGAEPLLVHENGDWVGFRSTYKQGKVIVLASADPLSNAGLADERAARFVFREILSSGPSGEVAFDEVHHSSAGAGVTVVAGPPTFNQLLFSTSAGRAVIYVALLTFAFLLLRGRRLGPPLPAQLPGDTQRTMYEHVQMLAGLYRRAGQFRAARDALANHYARVVVRKNSAAQAEAVARMRAARTESELIAAVAHIDESS